MLRQAEKIDGFLSNITWNHIVTWFKGRPSLFRQYQTVFIATYGNEFRGKVIEIGCERRDQHSKFFPQASNFICTNKYGDFDQYLDATDMKNMESSSVDGYVCVSVLEHVFNCQMALKEIDRTLKIGGRLLLTVPFAFPCHGEVDYWRFSKDSYLQKFSNYEIVAFVNLGGIFSSLSDALQHPKGNKFSARYVVCKFVGLFMALVGKFADKKDDFPLGYGLYAIKRGTNKDVKVGSEL